VKLLTASQQPILVRGLEAILAAAGSDWQMITFSGPPADIVGVARSEVPDILLIDFDPTEHFGVVLDLREQYPDCRIVLLARQVSPELAYQSLKAGVCGVLRASAIPERLIECLRVVNAGERWCDDDLKMAFFNAKTAVLSPRESQLVVLVSQGLKNKEISAALAISESTVRIYMSALFQRLGIKDRYELAIYGLRTFMQDPRVPTILDPGLAASDGTSSIRFLLLEKPRPKHGRMTARHSVAKAGS
jgi:two-component system, NarL family, nitrate/nitrite response regulator NarL